MVSPLYLLLIEDNPGDARLVKEELLSANSQITIQLEWADSLEKGLECLAAHHVDAVLLDLSLPDQEGLDTLEAVLSHAPQTPVVVVTGQADEKMVIKAMQAGAQDYLMKAQVDGRLLTRVIQYAIQRKQTEIQLADALAFNEQILTASPVGILTYKFSGECMSANACVAQMVGATIEQLKQQNFRTLESWKRSGLFEMAEHAIASRQLVAGDVHVLTTFGKNVWLRAQFVTFQSGEEQLLLLTFVDITEHKYAEAAMEASERRFRSWIEYSSDIITIIDTAGIIQYESPSIKRLLGYLPEEMLGKNAFSFIHPEDQEKVINLFLERIQHPQGVTSVEFRFRHNDGSWRFLEAIGRVYTDEHGELVALINSRDITERKQAEEAQRDSETRYRTVMENSVEAICLYELETRRVIAANPAFMNLLGYQAEEITNLSMYDIVAHEKSNIEEFLQRILSDGATSMDERLWRRKNGTLVPVEVTANRIQQTGKELIFVVGRDITQRKRAEEILREKEQLLSEAQRIGHIGSWSYDIPKDMITFSDEMYRLLDILPEEFQHNSQDFLTLIFPSDRSSTAAWLEDMKAGMQSKALNFRILSRTGELRYLHCTGAVEFGPDHKPTRFIGIMQDITERKAAEIQINQHIKRLMALSEIDRAIMSSFDQRYTLGVILSQVISQLQVDAADVLLLNEETQILEYMVGQGFRTKLIESAQLSLGESHAGRAARERRMIRLADLRETTSAQSFSMFVSAEGFVSYIGMPLISKGQVKGVLEVYQRSLLQPYQEWLDFFHTLVGQAVIALENAALFGNLQATNEELYRAYDATIEGWSRAMDLRDRETEGHTQRVTRLTLELARAIEMDESQLAHIRRGALLHDIGKLGVPDHILFKPAPLTPEEMEIMQKHPEWAYEMLAPIAYLKPALAIPYCHHEKWDGTGYPLGLKGEQIPLEARIFAIVDVWDALRSDRPYRKAWPEEQVLDYIQEHSGTHFDPRVVELFFNVVQS